MTVAARKALTVGDKVTYQGKQPPLHIPFKEGPLPIGAIKNGYAYCVKPDGYFTTWISLAELAGST